VPTEKMGNNIARAQFIVPLRPNLILLTKAIQDTKLLYVER